jgi:hypothetical protein
MSINKGLFITATLAFLSVSCSQSEKKTAQTTNSPSTVSRKKGAACCVSKVPSRFTIVKISDSPSVKKGQN